jgi:hypothetical protein
MAPSGDTTDEKILQCILNIDMTVRHLFLSVEDLKDLKIPQKSQVFTDMIQYSYIRICTALDEISILHGLAKDNIFLQDTLYCAQPAIKGINKYTGLKRARNLMLAHLNRDPKKQFTPWWDELITFKLPRTYKEINQILKFLNLINTIIVSRYQDKFKLFNDSMRANFEKYFQEVDKLEKDAISNPTPLDDVEIEIQKRCEEKGLVDFLLDPAMIKYWEHGIKRHFKPRPIDAVLKMSDDEIIALPEFQLAVQKFLANENRKRHRPLLSDEIAGLESILVAEFKKDMIRVNHGNSSAK